MRLVALVLLAVAVRAGGVEAAEEGAQATALPGPATASQAATPTPKLA